MIHAKIQDNNAMTSVSYFFRYHLPSSCEITHLDKQYERNDVMSLKRNEAVVSFSRLLIVASLSFMC